LHYYLNLENTATGEILSEFESSHTVLNVTSITLLTPGAGNSDIIVPVYNEYLLCKPVSEELR
jgi:hypothetical protein